jgi:trehalose 6-phosphate phosphatase
LDFDGTLAEIAPTPDAVQVAHDLSQLLRCVSWQLNGALAIVSGRPIASIDRYIDDAVPAVSGIGGAERRSAARHMHRCEIDPATLDRAREILTRFSTVRPGVLLEDKGVSLALHYRLAPEQADACREIVEACARSSGGHLERMDGKMVAELKPVGVSKAAAVLAFMNEAPFAGRRPVFVGDDQIDEAAFAVVAKTNGFSVIVGGRSPTAATTRLESVSDLHGWLRAFCQQAAVDGITPPKATDHPSLSKAVV